MSKHVQIAEGVKEAKDGKDKKNKGGWSVGHTATLAAEFARLIDLAYDCKAKDRYYYLWLALARRLQEFFTEDPKAKNYALAAAVAEQVRIGAYYRVEPFEHALEAASALWKDKCADIRKIPAEEFVEVECRLACSFSAVVDIVLAKQKIRPWDIKNWVYSDENPPPEGAKRSRAEDVLFWPRFFGELLTRVPVEDLSTALWLHLRLIEHQDLNVTKSVFFQLLKSTIGVGDGEMVSIEAPSEKSPHTFLRFIKKYGPTLDKVFGHMCGATKANGTLCSWLNYDIDAEKATAMLEAEENEENEEKGGEEKAGEEEPGRNFIIRLARDKESFVIHYYMTQNDDENDEQTTKLQVSKLVLDEEGYFAPSKKPTKYPNLREVLLRHVCKEYDYDNEAMQLDREKLEWAGAHRVRRTQTSVVGLAASNQAVREQEELLRALWNFLHFAEDEFGKTVREMADSLVANAEQRRNFEEICRFLDQDLNGELDSNETLIGIYMVLEPSLAGMFRNTSRSDPQLTLLELLPDQFVEGLDLAEFRHLFALTMAKLKFAAMREALHAEQPWGSEQTDHFLARIKQSINDRKQELSMSTRAAKEGQEAGVGVGEELNWREHVGGFLKLIVAFPFSIALSVMWPKNMRQSWERRKLYQSVGDALLRGLGTLLISTVLGFLYYFPFVSVGLYHGYLSKINEDPEKGDGISAVEAWAPIVLVLILIVVMGVGGGVQRKKEHMLAERRWLNAELVIRGSAKSRVSPKLLTTVGPDESGAEGGPVPWSPGAGHEPAAAPGGLPLPLARPGSYRVKARFDAVKSVFLDKSHIEVGMESRAYAQFGKINLNHYEGWAGVVRVALVILFSLGWALFPGLYRASYKKKFFGELPWEVFITLVYCMDGLLGLSAVLVFLQSSTLHYNSIRVSLSNVIALTDPRLATGLGFTHYLPMQQPENLEYWILLRNAVKRQVDLSMDTIVAATLVLDMAMMVVLVVRIFTADSPKFDLTNLLCAYSVLVLTIYLLQFVLTVVVLNEKVRRETMFCLEKIKLKLALEINKVEKLSALSLQSGKKEIRGGGRTVQWDAGEDKPTSEETLRDLHACNLIVESALSSMQNLDRPVTVLGFIVDTSFLLRLSSVFGAGILSSIRGVL